VVGERVALEAQRGHPEGVHDVAGRQRESNGRVLRDHELGGLLAASDRAEAAGVGEAPLPLESGHADLDPGLAGHGVDP
jgi:hypothetical protein